MRNATRRFHALPALAVGAIIGLAEPASADLLVEQWQGGGFGGIAGVDARIAAGPPAVSQLWAVIDFTDDPLGFAGEIPGSSRWPLATLLGQTGWDAPANTDFAARITGTIYISVADTYRFRTYNDDGVRLRVGGTTIISDNIYHPETPFNGSIFLTPGAYPIELIFFEGGGEASLEFTVAKGSGPFGHVGAIGGPPVTPPDGAPTAHAGPNQSVNEGQLVTLNGSLSSDPENDPLTYAWTQVSGTTVTLLPNAAAVQPTFTAPTVALGGETLSFDLTVSANGKNSTDTVNITIVNVNHTPVAEAGLDQSIAEGAPVTLHGEASFDIDTDPFTYTWVQVGGTPTVTLSSTSAQQPTFTAPYIGSNGAPGVVATLVFELRVDDGFPPDAPAPGYTLANVVDTVTIEITNLNNDPIAAAGVDQTVNENVPVALSGAASSDPDNDTLTYAWVQVANGSPAVALTGPATATPSFTAPFVSAGGADVEFELTVDDGYGGTDTDTVVIHVQNINDPPLASAAQPTVGSLWPPNHGLVAIGITGVADANNNATITITGVTQDEPTNGLGDGDTAIDAVINGDGTVLLRAERSGKGNGRVYHIHFTASDLEGSTSGVVKVVVPHSVKKVAIDGGELFNSTN